ncbi:MAG: LysE family translocator [Rhodothermaceae bacterium]
MELTILLSFITSTALLAIMPGPDNIYVLTESAVNGARNGIAISAGLATGLIIHTTLAASGLSLILANSPTAYQIIKYLGASYLIYLAVQSYLHRKDNVEGETHQSNRSIGKLFGKGFILNITNPKVSLFFLAFFPQFIDTNSDNLVKQMFLLGAVFMGISFVIFSVIAIISGSLRRFITDQKFILYTNYGKALILFILGIMVIFTD